MKDKSTTISDKSDQKVKVSVRTFCSTSHSRRLRMDDTVLPANYTNACL